jgi:hypothetical protein
MLCLLVLVSDQIKDRVNTQLDAHQVASMANRAFEERLDARPRCIPINEKGVPMNFPLDDFVPYSYKASRLSSG